MLVLFRNLFAPPRDLILVVVSLWIGLWLAEKRSRWKALSSDDINNLTFYPLLSFLLAGRLLFALENWNAFSQNLGSLLSLNLELFDPLGGVVAALIVAWAYSQRRKLILWSTLDALTPLFATLAVGLGLAHLASGSAFGSVADLPWGIELWGAIRHPSQIYEIIAAAITLGLLWFRKPVHTPGVQFLFFLTLTSGYHVFLQAFRGDSILLAGGIRLEQLVALLILTSSLWLLNRRLSLTAGSDRNEQSADQ